MSLCYVCLNIECGASGNVFSFVFDGKRKRRSIYDLFDAKITEASKRLGKKLSYVPTTHSVTRKLLLEQKEEGSEIKQVPIYPFPDTISHKYT